MKFLTLIFGILSAFGIFKLHYLASSFIFAILGLIFGVLSFKNSKIFSVFGILFSTITLVYIFFLVFTFIQNGNIK